MSSLINILQSFISWIYQEVTDLLNVINGLFQWVLDFKFNQLDPILNIFCPPWLQIIILVGMAVMVVFLAIRIIVELL